MPTTLLYFCVYFLYNCMITGKEISVATQIKSKITLKK